MKERTFIIYERNVEWKRCEFKAASLDEAERLYLDGDEEVIGEKKWTSNTTVAYEIYDNPDFMADPVKTVTIGGEE